MLLFFVIHSGSGSWQIGSLEGEAVWASSSLWSFQAGRECVWGPSLGRSLHRIYHQLLNSRDPVRPASASSKARLRGQRQSWLDDPQQHKVLRTPVGEFCELPGYPQGLVKSSGGQWRRVSIVNGKKGAQSALRR